MPQNLEVSQQANIIAEISLINVAWGQSVDESSMLSESSDLVEAHLSLEIKDP